MYSGQQPTGYPQGYYSSLPNASHQGAQTQGDAASQGWIPPPDGGHALPTNYAPAQDWYPILQGAPSTAYPIAQTYSAQDQYSGPPSQAGSFGPSYPTTQPSSVSPDAHDAKADKTRKKKRKGEEPSPPFRLEKERDGDKDKEKRVKTGRACDACRSKKIRCDILSSNQRNGDGAPICAHCKQYDLECTFFLPISETRFKKRKAADEQTDGNATNSSVMHDGTASPREKGRHVPQTDGAPSSLSFLLQTSMPGSTSDAYDLREHNVWDISDDGHGHVKISAPSAKGSTDDSGDLSKAHNRLNRPLLSSHTMSLLVNAYFDHIAHLFPVISKAEFMTKKDVSPLLLYAVCGLGATRREFPRDVFAGVRGIINGLIRSNDILSDARFENVQALLVLSQAGDLHAQPTAATASASLVRMATATRMAQDLGLHRESTSKPETAEDVAFLELRRRVWASCVIMDRWYGAALGIPLLIDLLDCDVLVPATIEVIPGVDRGDWQVNESFLALSEHLKLSILIGRVLRTIYSPTGLNRTSDADLYGLLNDITAWREGLPESLRFTGNDSSHAAGLLHMCHAALQFLFWRVFMRVQYTCPPHLTFQISLENWDEMVQWSSESLRWLAANDEVLDTLFIFPYTATSCALIQYHSWARRRTAHSLEMLKLVRDTATRWTEIVQPDQMSIRRKTCETMTLLYSLALKTNPGLEEVKDPQANAGVASRMNAGKVIWIKDEIRAGGGIWVAKTKEDREQAGVPADCCMLESELEPGSEVHRQFMMAEAEGTGEALVPREAEADIVDPNPAINLGAEKSEKMNPGALIDVQTGVNVNPSINENQILENGSSGAGSGLVPSLIDDLPLSQFDFQSWEHYFQALGNAAGDQSFGGL